MNRTLTIQLSDKAYAALRRRAQAEGTSPARLIAEALEEQFGLSTDPASSQLDTAKQAARERFEHHIGAVDLGRPTGIDNEQIDADLARAYADNHERP